MPKPSLISMLPQDIQNELDKKLIGNGFSNYHGLAAWLGQKGYSISPSSIHRYGQDFKSKCENIKLLTAQAKALVENVGDDDNAVGESLSILAQSKLFDALLKIDIEAELEGEDGEGKKSGLDFLGLIRAVATLNRSSVAVKKFREEIKQKVQLTADKISSQMKAEGLSDERADWLRSRILEIAE